MDKNEDYRCIDVYEAMRDAVPDGCNLMDVIRGAEVIIADAKPAKKDIFLIQPIYVNHV